MYKKKFFEILESREDDHFYVVCNFSKGHKSTIFNQVLKMGQEYHLVNTVNRTSEVIEDNYVDDPMFVIVETNNTDGWTCDCGNKNTFSQEYCTKCNTHYEARQVE